MSLLLDALRKSEAQRRAGQSPGLDLGSGSTSSERRRRRGQKSQRLGWLLVLLDLIAGGTGLAWWQPWLGRVMPHTDPSGPGTGTAAVAAQTIAPSAAAAPASRATVDPPGSTPVRPSAAQDPVPVEASASASVAAEASDAHVAARTARVEVPMTGRTEPGAESSDDSDRSAESSVATTAQVPDRAPGRDEAATRPEPAAPAASPPQDAALDGVIRPWELPQALRAEFPQIRLSVHFYSSKPADRFVLIGGERRGEGDELGGDVRIEEIRKRGMIVEYRNYRILIE
ncbi:MAG: hypothetical protein CVV18_03835 [Gammaproteobacteria bacterium HGW-Gammaproteobacteria-8]|nr:MAG: hypothetical protein CVV18_03835 [Gammaproteobacteria bacterium HGW-Gammaproteobacteria-8]